MRSKLLLIPVATGFWYFSSSINAVASQHLFRGLLAKSGDERKAQEVIVLSTVLTLLQLCTGGLLSLGVLVWFSGRQTSNGNNPVKELVAGLQIQDMFIGLLHCIGSICTNIGYGHGSASLVQVIKLLEPIETLLLAALVQRSLQVLSLQKVASTLTIMGGTYMLLATNPSIEVRLKSVVFAILSGLCMASRNVLSKKRQAQKSSESESLPSVTVKDEQDAHPTKDNDNAAATVRAILLRGMHKFAAITVAAAACALVVAAAATLHSSAAVLKLVPLLMQASPQLLRQTILFHCLYNMASITVLSLTSATSHSLLNVGKRIANVMIASVAFSIPLTTGGRVGLAVAAVGACVYNDGIAAVLVRRGRAVRAKHVAAGAVVAVLVGAQFRYLNGPLGLRDGQHRSRQP